MGAHYNGRSQEELEADQRQTMPGQQLLVDPDEWRMLTAAGAKMENFRLRDDEDLQAWKRTCSGGTATTATAAETPMGADEKLLRDALLAVTGERRKAYGDPEQNFETIAQMWNLYLGHQENREGRPPSRALTPGDVAQMMILVKVARLAQTPGHRDSLIDIAGYAACAARC